MTIFRHIVGKSTLTEGMTVPRNLENWIHAPSAGEKRSITLLFDQGQAKATLRRIANARGHVQIKYENKECLPFREWLKSLFSATITGLEGEYLEFAIVGEDTFRVTPFPLLRQAQQRLFIADWIFHKTNNRVFEEHTVLREIPAIVQSIEFNALEGQRYYNHQLSHVFGAWDWEAEKKVIPDLPLKSDFIKSNVQVEVEFGNARTYYQDYVKFMIAFNQQAAEIGVLLVPSSGFARTLCAVGQTNAIAKGRHSYSGMVHFDKVNRELKYLAFMLSMPIVIAAIDVHHAKAG
jgi:hypothetical protein